jgi:hypothetical protein
MRLGQRFASALVRSRRPVRQEVPAIGSTPRSRSHVGLAAILMILFVRYRASESFRASSAIGELLESHNWIGYPDPGLGWLLVKGLRRVPCPPAMRIAFMNLTSAQDAPYTPQVHETRHNGEPKTRVEHDLSYHRPRY